MSAVVNDLGVLLDSQLSMADHIAALSRSCVFYMRQLRSIKLSLMPDAMRMLIHAFVSSQLDYCNSILAGVSSQLLQKLQVIQNAATRLITGARMCDHMTRLA